jgi:single-stranded-DNA-specific exonuclease
MASGSSACSPDDEARAANCAQELDRLNRERRQIESGMLDGRDAALDALVEPPGARSRCSMPAGTRAWSASSPRACAKSCTGRRSASRARRTASCAARALDPGTAPARCLDLVAKREPGLLLRFGGHAQAAA